MLVILTAILILPDDATSREIARWQESARQRIVNIDAAAADYRKQISQTYEWLHKYGTGAENWNYLSDMLAMYQARLDTRLMHRDMAERAELRGPPFAAAVWRVKPVSGK